MTSPTVSITPSMSISQTPRQRDADVESSTAVVSTIDIEHVPVNDDPRQWGPARKVRVSHDAPCNSSDTVPP